MSHNPNDIFAPERLGLITGSRVVVLRPKRSAEVGQKQYAKELANQKFFNFYDNTNTWQTEHGNNSESSACEYFQTNFDSSVEYHPPFMFIGDFGGQADAIHKDYGLDFKCPTSLQKWLDYLHVGIDDQQYHQGQMYMWLYEKPAWKFCAYLLETNRMSDNGEVYPVACDKRMIVVEVLRDETWSAKTIEAATSVIAMRDFFYNKLKQQFNG